MGMNWSQAWTNRHLWDIEGLRLWANGHLWDRSRVLGFEPIDIYHNLSDQSKVSDFEPMSINGANLGLRFWNNRYLLEQQSKF